MMDPNPNRTPKHHQAWSLAAATTAQRHPLSRHLCHLLGRLHSLD